MIVVELMRYWGLGSSRGRGTRAAGWFDDYIHDQGAKHAAIESYILAEGVSGWANAGEEFTKMMDEYREECWRK